MADILRAPLLTTKRDMHRKVSFVQRTEQPKQKASKKSCFFGVETWGDLVWEDWELGQEYTKLLTISNVCGKVKKLKFRPPVSEYFSTLCPQTIILSPGTSFSLPITFRPLQKCIYTDTTEFQCNEGTFQVNLVALMLRHVLELPDLVQLPVCAVQNSTSTSFLFHNVSKLRTRFQWAVEPPFELSPLNGILEPGEQCDIMVTFKPQQVLEYQTEASCTFGEDGEDKCTMPIQGLCKYPHLQIRLPGQEEDSELLEFGNVVIGNCLEKHFQIFNPSSVTASFSLTRMKRPAFMESVFQCNVKKGQVASRSALKIPVCFTPVTVDSTSVEYFILAWPGGFSKVVLKIIGTCIGPQVSLSSSVVDFSCVEAGDEAMRTINIINSSTAPAHYQFDMDTGNHSVFKIDQPSGTLTANKSLTLQLKFCPHHAIAYHKRAVCIILHREPLFLDLIGSCYSQKLNPAILHPRHLHVYRQNLLWGLTCYPPNMLGDMLEKHKLQLDESGALLPQLDSLEDTSLSGLPLSQWSSMEEYFHMNLADTFDRKQHSNFPQQHVTVKPSELLFTAGPSFQFVSITNHTKGKISLLWTPAADSPFSISPLMCDLNPLKSTTFRVTYRPKQDDVFHAVQLECFAFYKVLGEQRPLEDWAICPPWCLTVRVMAYCFKPGEHYIPNFSLQKSQVLFSSLSQVSYRSILLENTGHLPIIFKFPLEECPAVSVLPCSGLVPPGCHQILTFQTTPVKENPVSLPLSLELNSSPKHIQMLSLVCVAERPRVIFDEGRKLFFRPTPLGFWTEKTLRIRNFSRASVHFQWMVSGSEHTVLSVQPESGVLQPNEFQVQTWSFTPLEKMLYRMKASLIYWPVQTPDYKCTGPMIKFVGLATIGSIEADHLVTDLGEILVGSTKSFTVLLLNRGFCEVSFSLVIQQRITAPGLNEESVTNHVVLEMDTMTGMIPTGCKLLIPSNVNLTERAQYIWTISYQILDAYGLVMGDPYTLCQVQAEGVYPTLEVADACGHGSVEGLSKPHIWDLFSLNLLNNFLRGKPTPTKLSPRRLLPCSTMVDFNFSSAPLGVEPSIILLMFKNIGSIAVDWLFMFLEDLFQITDQNKAPFSIVPYSGKLQPGQQETVQFTYRHDFPGTLNVPVLLRLFHGQEILLNFVGMTVEKDTCHLHILSTQHIFASVSIGLFKPLKQMYKMYNRGDLPLRYHVDTSTLKQLQKENFNHPILQCLNPNGEVQPGHTAVLEWVFFPLEAKTYTVDIPIHVVDGDSVLVTFVGCGFDKKNPVPLQLHDGHFTVPTQKLPFPGQPVFLSEERVCFGDIPVFCRNTRILFMANIHTESVLYSWREQDGKQAVQIHPASGSLSAGESVLCILSIYTSDSPTFYQQDLICEITPHAAQTQYQIDLQQWEQWEAENANEKITSAEVDLTHSNPNNNPDQECTGTEQRSSSEIQTYKILPPIRSSEILLSEPAARIRKKAEVKVERIRPDPPRSTLLYLEVTACSYSLRDYKPQFPSEFPKHHIYRCVQPKSELSENCQSPTQLPPLTHGPERDILTYTLGYLLRSLLDDPDFHKELQDVLTEPVPYFSQFQPASSITSTTSSCSDTIKEANDSPDSRQATYCPGTVVHTKTPSDGQCEEHLFEEIHPDIRMEVRESIGRSSEFRDLTEEILLNTVQNLMMEAFLGELVLMRYRNTTPLPPGRARKSGSASVRQSRGQVVYEKVPDQEPSVGPSTDPSWTS